MSGQMDRLFRRTQPVTVITQEGAFLRRGIVQEIGSGTELGMLVPTRCGELSVPLYRYMGNAKELLDSEEAVLSIGKERFTVLSAKKISGLARCTYIVAVLERQVTDDDGE